MKNLDAVTAPEDVPTKAYVDAGGFWSTIPAFSVATGVAVKAPTISVGARDTAFFSVTAGTLTLLQAGYYMITWGAITDGGGSARNFVSIIMSNGTVYRSFFSAAEGIVTVTALHYAAAPGQTMQVDAYHTLGSTQNFQGNVNAHYLGP